MKFKRYRWTIILFILSLPLLPLTLYVFDDCFVIWSDAPSYCLGWLWILPAFASFPAQLLPIDIHVGADLSIFEITLAVFAVAIAWSFVGLVIDYLWNRHKIKKQKTF